MAVSGLLMVVCIEAFYITYRLLPKAGPQDDG